MADLNHVITLGIGTPADIPHFILVGLSVNQAAAVVADLVLDCRSEDWVIELDVADYAIDVPGDETGVDL